MHKKSIALLAIGLIAIGAIAGIAFLNSRSDTSTHLESVTIILDWTPNVNHVGIFVAQANGYFKEEGLAVEIIQPGEVYASAAVLGGQAQFGIEYQEYLTLFSEEQSGLISIAAILQSNTSGFAVRATDAITTIAQFDGIRYGTFQTPFEEPTLNALLQCNGVEHSRIEFVPAGTDLLAMLDQNQADLVWIFYGTQGFQAQELGIDIRYFGMRDEQDCIPDYYTPLIVAETAYAQQNPHIVTAFLSALQRGHRFVVDNPQESAHLFQQLVPELSLTELQKSVPWLTQFMFTDDGVWGVQNSTVWNTYAQWMFEQGLLETAPNRENIQRLFTNRYIP